MVAEWGWGDVLVTPRAAGHDSRQPTPPRWLPSGSRRLLPPAPWPPAGFGRAHPFPVDLSALGNESYVSLCSCPCHPERVGLSLGKAVSAWVSADGDDLSPAACPASPSRVKQVRRSRRRRLQLKQSWECLVPSVKLRCGLKAVHPDESGAAFYSNA